MEIGWVLQPSAWGRGYATELAEAVIQYTFEQVQAPRAVARIAPANVASIAVARKLLMHLDQASSTEETLVFVRSREPVQEGRQA